MKIATILIVAISIMTGNAGAAVTTYKMVFSNNASILIGRGAFSFDPETNEAIYLTDVSPSFPRGRPCSTDPNSSDYQPDTCRLIGSFTPLQSFYVKLGSIEFPHPGPIALYSGLYREGLLALPDRQGQTVFFVGEWSVPDKRDYTLSGAFLILGIPSSASSVVPFTLYSTPFIYPEFGAITRGVVTFSEIPLPAAGWLFASAVAGAFGFAARRKPVGRSQLH